MALAIAAVSRRCCGWKLKCIPLCSWLLLLRPSHQCQCAIHPLPACRVNMEMEAAKRQPAGTTTCDGTGQRRQCKGVLFGPSKDRRDYCLVGLATPSLIVCHRPGCGSHPTMPKFDYGPAAESAGGRKD